MSFDLLGSPWVMLVMGVGLLGIIGLLIFLRTRPDDD